MDVQEAVNVNSDLNDWDPMLEAYTVGKKYEQGPGADLQHIKNQNNEGIKIFMKNLPFGITEEGITNLCLGAGIPTSVFIVRSGRYAFVVFKTMREAELAIRDLNNTPPYFIRATFAKEQGDDKSPKINEEKDTEDSWNIDSFETFPVTKKINLNVKLSDKKFIKVSPYFSICSEYRNPSLVMRQRNLHFKTGKECVSMGRGYINFGDVKQNKCENRIFSCKSDDWVENNKTTSCNYCGSLTFKTYEENGENYCSNSCETSATSKFTENSELTTIFDFFTPGICGTLDFYNETQGVIMKCCILLDGESDKYRQLMNYNKPTKEIINAKKGDKVLVSKKGRFFRGVVCKNYEEDLYSVALIDYSETILVKKVYTLSNNLAALPSLGGTITFLTDNIPKLDSIKFRVKEKKFFGSWLCDVISNNDVCEMLLQEWTVPEGMKYVPLESGCSVILTSYEDMKTVFVRRIDGSWNEDFIRLSNDVAAYSLEAKNYKNLPKLGEICGALFTDGCFYRAVVRSVRRNSVYVSYMDYGNEEETELKNLRYLPDAVRKINCFAVRVRLKNVPDKSSPESVNYFNRLTAYGNVLRLVFNNGEVILTDETNGDTVNDIVANMLVPIWEKDSSVFLKSGEIYFLESLKELNFHPGEIQDIVILNVNKDEFIISGVFWATQNRSDYLGHLNGELKQDIFEYFHYLLDNPYCPRMGELCLVQYEDDFYRGVLLDDKTSPYKVFLIDFGISTYAETKNMRKILKEFLELPALALQCRISDFDKYDKDKIQQIMEYLLKMNKKCLRNVKIVKNVDGVYEVSIPFENGLLG